MRFPSGVRVGTLLILSDDDGWAPPAPVAKVSEQVVTRNLPTSARGPESRGAARLPGGDQAG